VKKIVPKNANVSHSNSNPSFYKVLFEDM